MIHHHWHKNKLW